MRSPASLPVPAARVSRVGHPAGRMLRRADRGDGPDIVFGCAVRFRANSVPYLFQALVRRSSAMMLCVSRASFSRCGEISVSRTLHASGESYDGARAIDPVSSSGWDYCMAPGAHMHIGTKYTDPSHRGFGCSQTRSPGAIGKDVVNSNWLAAMACDVLSVGCCASGRLEIGSSLFVCVSSVVCT